MYTRIQKSQIRNTNLKDLKEIANFILIGHLHKRQRKGFFISATHYDLIIRMKSYLCCRSRLVHLDVVIGVIIATSYGQDGFH